MHESFHPDRPDTFTREWFAWANSLFGEFICRWLERNPNKERWSELLIAASRKRVYRQWIKGYLFILPSIIGFSVFVAYPLISSLYYALTDWDGINKPKFVGFDNFTYMFTVDPAFWKSLRVTFYFVLLNVPSSLIFGLVLAMLLNRKLPGIKFFRTAFYLPTVIPAVATLTLWLFMYHPQYGLANQVLRLFGLPAAPWLTSRIRLFYPSSCPACGRSVRG